MPSFESLLVKGILVGVGAAVVSVILFSRWIPNGMTVNLIKRYAVNFFGGIGIGVTAIALIVGAILYSGWVHSKHILDTIPPP